MTTHPPFEFEYGEQTLVVKPHGQLTSLAETMEHDQLSGFIKTIQRAGFKNVLIDFSETQAVGSSLLGALAEISHLVRENEGRMALCDVDENDRHVLEVSHLNQLWKIYDTRAAALAEIGN